MGITDFILGAIETAADIGASFIPGGSFAKKVVKKSIKGLARATGMAKNLKNKVLNSLKTSTV